MTEIKNPFSLLKPSNLLTTTTMVLGSIAAAAGRVSQDDFVSSTGSGLGSVAPGPSAMVPAPGVSAPASGLNIRQIQNSPVPNYSNPEDMRLSNGCWKIVHFTQDADSNFPIEVVDCINKRYQMDRNAGEVRDSWGTRTPEPDVFSRETFKVDSYKECWTQSQPVGTLPQNIATCVDEIKGIMNASPSVEGSPSPSVKGSPSPENKSPASTANEKNNSDKAKKLKIASITLATIAGGSAGSVRFFV